MAQPLKKNKKPKKGETVAPPPMPAVTEKPSTKPTLAILGTWIIPVVTLCAFFAFLQKQVLLGEVLVVLVILFQGLKMFHGRLLAQTKEFLEKLTPRQLGWLLGFLGLAFSAVMLTFPSASWMAPISKALPFQQSYWVLILTWCGMIAVFWALPGKEHQGELSARIAHYWLGVVVVGWAVLRFYPTRPLPFFYSESYLTNMGQMLYIRDSGDFRSAFSSLMGERDPLVGFFMLILLKFLPGVSIFALQRFCLAFFELATIWVLYLLGKETADRRVGVFAALMAALSQTLTVKVVSGAAGINEPMGVALALLFLFRLLKKSDLSHFLQWGAVLALVIYMDPVFLFWTPFLLIGVFVWVIQRNKKEGQGFEWPIPLIPGLTLLFALVYFHYNLHAFPRDNGIARLEDISGAFLPCILVCLYLVLFVSAFPKLSVNPRTFRWIGWISAVWLCLVLSFPIAGSGPDLSRMNAVLLDNGTWANSSLLLQRSGQAFLDLFWKMGDRSSVSIGDPLFGCLETVLIALGSAYCIARPTWKKGQLFLAVLAGASLFIVVNNNPMESLAGCSAPFFIMAGLGLNALIPGILEPGKGTKAYKLAFLLFVALEVWTAHGVVSRVYHQWAEMPARHLLIYQQAEEDLAQGKKVYLAPDLAPDYMNILYMENPVRVLGNSNLIYADAGHDGPNVVVYAGSDQPAFKNQWTQAFPTAQWTSVPSPEPASNGSPIYWRCLIPYSDIEAYSRNYLLKIPKRPLRPNQPPPPPPLFEIKPTLQDSWERRYCDGHQGLTFGLLHWMDQTVQVNDPIPAWINLDPMEADYRGVIHVQSDGNYLLSWKTENRAKFLMDDKKIFDVTLARFNLTPGGDYMEPEKTGIRSFYLKAGDHRVEVMTLFQRSRNAPIITIQRQGTPGEGRSLWSSFNF